jgi:glucans biosynthesis protein C
MLSSPSNPVPVVPLRRYDIDWLRVLVIFLLIPYHSARIFDFWRPFYIKNPIPSPALSWFVAFADPWGMPLLFLLAGSATWFALRKRTGGQYAVDRLKRLLVPLIFGALVIVPPQGYFAMLDRGLDPGSYIQYLSQYFSRLSYELTGYDGGFTPAHLWFIFFLLVYSLLGLPIFLLLRGKRGSRWIAGFADLFEKPGMLYILVIPLFLCEALPQLGDYNVCLFFLFFIYGFLLVADSRLDGAIVRHTWVSLLLGIPCMVVVLAIQRSGVIYADFTLPSIGLALLRNLNTWLWVLALMGLARRYLSFGNSLLAYAGQASYPVYILHQTVIVMVGYAIVHTALTVASKYLLIVLLSGAATLIIYEIFVRRTRITRFLFGLPPTLAFSRPEQVPDLTKA